MIVFMGYDEREKLAYDVAAYTLRKWSPSIPIYPLEVEKLAAQGLHNRPVSKSTGPAYDIPSRAYASTDFAVTRFLVPILVPTGWALFVDCDVLFHTSVEDLLALCDPTKAVMVVKHNHVPQCEIKMDGVPQQAYSRKNWSSVMLFNCDHPGNRRLTIEDVNRRPGRDLHAFYWLTDDEIGELPNRWNWLVGVQPRPEQPAISHYTLGGPWLPHWESHEQNEDEEWLRANRERLHG